MSDTLINRIPPLVKNFGFGMFCLGATLALGVTVGSQSLGRAIANFKREPATIQVKGVSEIAVVSDWGAWDATVNARGTTLAETFATLEVGIEKLRAFILANSFEEGDLIRLGVSTSTLYTQDKEGHSTNTIEGYRLSQSIMVRSSRVEAIRAISRRVTDLVRDGVEVSSGSTVFRVSGLEEIKMALLEKATQNAFERASLLAKGSGSGVGELMSASQGVFQIVPLGSTDVSDWGISDTSTIDKTVKAVVSLTYAIDS